MRATLIFVSVLLITAFSSAQSGEVRFIENKGQWPDQVLFKADIPGGSCYLESDRFRFDFLDSEQLFRCHQAHTGEPLEHPLEDFLRGHAYSVHFVDAQVPEVNQEGRSDDYFNYFIGNNPDKWVSHARAWNRITLNELYPGIDLKVYTNGQNVKYDFAVQPGADPGSIALQYEGVDQLKIKKGELLITTSVNKIIEQKPFAYQMIGGQIVEVACSYELNDQQLKFSVDGAYDPELTLIIDPELQFSTYSGSFADNFGFTATYDNQGFLYSGSSIFANGYPTTDGAYQTTWAGGTGQGTLTGTDIGITKYDTTGTALVYSTYIGGESDELPHSLIVNENGELYLYGTTSSPNYPTTSGAFQETFFGGSAFAPIGIGVSYVNGSDIIVSKLSEDGSELLASTFIGGSGNDGVNTSSALKFNYADEMRGEVLFDNNGDVIIASTTFSTDFPVSPDGFQTSIGGGQDGCIVKLDPDLENMLHGTYLGGMQADATYSVAVNGQNHIVVSGGTVSANFPTTPGVVSNSFNGGTADGYISVFNEDLSSLTHSSFYGTIQYDQLYFVEHDGEDNIYVYGQTRGPDNALIQNAAFNVSNGGMLVAKFLPDLSETVWSTRFGNGENSNPNLSPAAFLVDVCNKIYLSGWGGQTNVASNSNTGFTNGLPVTDDAYQNTTDGSDFYIMVMEEDASEITYASFFGGAVSNEHVDGGTSRFDRSGKIYQSVCAGCGSNDDFPTFPDDAWSDTNNSSNCNNGVFKFDFALPITIANFAVDDVCLPDQVTVTNLSNGSESYTWLLDGEVVSNESNPSFDITEPGIYTIQLLATNPETCNFTDSLTQQVEVFPGVELDPIDDIILCEPETITLIADASGTATSFTWADNPDFSNPINSNPLDSVITVNPNGTTTYYVLADNGLCDNTQSVTVTPAPEANLQIPDISGCDGDTIQLELTNLTPEIEFNEITWTPVSNIIDGLGTETVTVVTNGTFTLQVDVLTENGCLLTDSATISTYPLSLSVSEDTIICNEQDVTLSAVSDNAQSLLWSDDAGFDNILNPGGDYEIEVSPQETTTYYVQAQNENCTRTDEVTIFVVDGSVALNPEHTICLNDTLIIQAANLIPSIELSYEWSPEDQIISGQNTSTIFVSPQETTVYEVLVTTEDGCTFTQNTVVYVSNIGSGNVTAYATPNTIPAGESSELTAIPNNPDYQYSWSPTDGLENPYSATTMATPEETTTYTVTIIDGTFGQGQCITSANVELRVYDFVCGPPNLFLPNAFTPNGDGNNDILYLRGDNITSMHLAIYNRWGELVFETRDQSVGWDGTFRGKPVDPAVFVYHLEADCGDGLRYFDKGNVTVIR